MTDSFLHSPLSSPHGNIGMKAEQAEAPPSPRLLDYVCAVNGYPPPATRSGFTWCEMDCGNGEPLLILAAANPSGRFYGLSFHPGRTDAAEELRATAGVNNLFFMNLSPAEFSQPDFPHCDYLLMPGASPFPGPDARRHVLAGAARLLKPGGIVLTSYRTPHTALLMEPVLHFLRVAAAAPGDRRENIRAGFAELQALRDQGAALFQVSPFTGPFLDGLGAFDLDTLDDTFLQGPPETRHFDEVCGELAGLGLNYAGSLPLAVNYAPLSLPANLQDRRRILWGQRLQETWKDLVRLPFFRQDIFIDAPAASGPGVGVSPPADVVFGSFLSREQFTFSFAFPGLPAIGLDGPLFPKLADLLAENAMTIRELLAAPHLREHGGEEILSALAWLAALEQVRPFAAPPLREAAPGFAGGLSPFNAACLHRLLPGGRAVTLASRTLGGGVTLKHGEALALLALAEAGAAGAETWAGQWLVNNPPGGAGEAGEPPAAEQIRRLRERPRYLAVLGLSAGENDGPNGPATFSYITNGGS